MHDRARHPAYWDGGNSRSCRSARETPVLSLPAAVIPRAPLAFFAAVAIVAACSSTAPEPGTLPPGGEIIAPSEAPAVSAAPDAAVASGGNAPAQYPPDEALLAEYAPPDFEFPTPTPTPMEPSYPDCTAAQLSGRAGYQPATAQMGGGITLTNESSSACTLRGAPAGVAMIDGFGENLPLPVIVRLSTDPWSDVSLGPGGEASMFIVWSSWCPPGTSSAGAHGAAIEGGVVFVVHLNAEGGAVRAPAFNFEGELLGDVPRCGSGTSVLSVGVLKPREAR